MVAANRVKVHRGRTNTLQVNLGFDVTGETLTSQIRTEPNQDATLLATWSLVVDDAPTGALTLTLDNAVTADIAPNTGYMDIKRLSAGGEPIPVFDEPLEVLFIGSVTV